MDIVVTLLIVAFGIILGFLINFFLNQKRISSYKLELEKSKLICSNLENQITSLEEENQNFYIENRNLAINQAVLEEKERNLNSMQSKMYVDFENISRKIMAENSQKFSEHSSLSLKNLLEPMKENFNEFKTKIEQQYSQNTKDRLSLHFQIENIIKTNNQLNTQAENLTNALKGNNKTQGNWGEMQLEVLLESSGLIKGIDYHSQGSSFNIKEGENNKRYMPDIIISLPQNKHIIIDAKVSLIAYEHYCNSEDEEEKSLYLKNFLNAIKLQIKDLSNKAYHDKESLNSPDYTIMFMPIESAYILAITEDKSLHQEAWGKKVILVSPNTLFAILKTIAHIISLEKRNKFADEIAKQAGNMIDKFVNFNENLEKIGKNLDSAKNSYDDALKQLTTGRGNLTSQAKKLLELGIKSKKNLSLNKDSMDEEDDFLTEGSIEH